MPPASGQIALSYGGDEVVVTAPNFGYKSIVKFPWDIIRLDNGKHAIRDDNDSGILDSRSCKCQCTMPSAEAALLYDFLAQTARGVDYVLTLPSNSGFFPFGPDKGDTGVFTVRASIDKKAKITKTPWLYSDVVLYINNVGSYPAYTLPAQIDDGPVNFGTVTNCQFPEDMYDPDSEIATYWNQAISLASKYVTRNLNGDSFGTSWIQGANESKAAAIIYYLTKNIRSSSFTVDMPSGVYPYGPGGLQGGYVVMRLTTDSIEIVHNRYNDFSIELKVEQA